MIRPERKERKNGRVEGCNLVFSESQRYYKHTYLEIDEVYDEELEVSLFSSEEGPYEI